MSQTSIQSYFPTRKRPANDEARGKNEVLILDQNQTRTAVHKVYPANTQSPSNLAAVPEEKVLKTEKNAPISHAPKLHTVVRNIQFDSPKGKSPQTRRPRTRRISVEEGQADIRDTFQKKACAEEAKVVPFEKRGSLTPRKSGKKETGTPKKLMSTPAMSESIEANVEINVNPSTPKKASDVPSLVAQKDMTLGQMKDKLLKSKRLNELRARINKIGQLDKKLENVQKKAENKREDAVSADKPCIKQFDGIELEIPVSPQKTMHSQMMSPTKIMRSPTFASPSKIMTPKKAAPSPIKVTPTKEPAYKRFADLVSKEEFALPEHYRLLGELFRCIDTVSAMLFNRKETITFSKLKPSVQEMLRRNLTIDNLAQIKFLFPEAYEFEYKKYHKFATARKQDSYELILIPRLEKKAAGDKMDADDAFVSKLMMGPDTLLQRRRKMYSLLLDKVMDEHEEYLKSVGMEIKRKELTRWHPAFDVNSCKPIAKAEMPSRPDSGNMQSASEILDKAKQMFHCNTRMEKALQLLAESETTKSSTEGDAIDAGSTSVVDTPPSTPKAESQMTNSMLKGIPKSLLEKVRAKQAAKALEEMTRPIHADKEISVYAQLPSLAQVLRNVFVTEKKNVLSMEFVVAKLEKSFRTKMSPEDLEKHLRLMSTLLPTWITILIVRKITYIKLLRDVELSTITERLDLCAKEKMKSYQSRS